MNLKKKILIFIMFLISSFVGLASLTVSVSPSKTTFGVNDEIIYIFYVQANAENFTNGSIKLVVPAELSNVTCVQDPRMGGCSLIQENDTGGQTRDNYILVNINNPILAGQFIQLSVIATVASNSNDSYNFTGLATTSSPVLTTTERTVTGDPITISPKTYKDTTGKTTVNTGDFNESGPLGWEGYDTDKVPGESYYYQMNLSPTSEQTGTFLKNIILTDKLPPEVEYIDNGNTNLMYDSATHTLTCKIPEQRSEYGVYCYAYVKIKETTPIGTILSNSLSATWESGDTGKLMSAAQVINKTTIIGDSNDIRKYSSQYQYAPGESISYQIYGNVNKNNTNPITIVDTLANTYMQIRNINIRLQRTNDYSSTETATIKLYKNDGTVEYKTVVLLGTGREISAGIDLTLDFPDGSTDQITKWELVTSNLSKDDYMYHITTDGIVLNTDRNGVAVIDGQKLKNDVTLVNNDPTKPVTATISPIVKVLYNVIESPWSQDRAQYVGELASKVPSGSYNGTSTTWCIILAKSADVTLTSNISTTNPFNQVVKSFNRGIPAEFANKSYEVKLYKNGSTVPYKTLTGTTVASGVNQVWFDESATFTGTTDLLTKYEVVVKGIEAYSKSQTDYRYIYLNETNNILEKGPNGEIPVAGIGIGGTSDSTTVLPVTRTGLLSTGETSTNIGNTYLRKANEDSIRQSAYGAYNTGVDIPLSIYVSGGNDENMYASEDFDQLPKYVDPNSKYYRKENTVVGILLPAQFEYSKTTSIPTTGTCAYNAAEVINNYNGTGRQLVRFTQVDPTCSNNTDI